jgi:GNAT superfamily N-acetyltransferase
MHVGERIDLEVFRAELAEELVLMWRESFAGGVGVEEYHPVEDHVRFLLEELVPKTPVRVAFVDGTLVGFVAATPTSVAQLYVRAGYHRQGIGSRLLAWAKEQSNGSLWLYTFARNSGARAFYEHHRFRIVARGFEPNWQLEDLRYEWTGGR